MKTVSLIRSRVSVAFAMAAMAVLTSPAAAWASTLTNASAQQHFGWLTRFYNVASGVLPMISMFAIVGGIIMFGLGGGNEGAMKKIGPVVACFGIASFILSSGSFLGIGSAVL